MRLAVPGNWRPIDGNGAITYAPEGGYFQAENGQSAFTHGMQVGVVQVQGRNLQQKTEQLLQGFAESNPQLRRQSGYSRTNIGGRSGLTTTLSNVSEATGQSEAVNVSTVELSDGSLLFLIGVGPMLPWRVADAAELKRKVKPPGAAFVIGAVLTPMQRAEYTDEMLAEVNDRIPAGRHTFSSHGMRFASSEQRPFAATLGAEHGGHFDGRHRVLSADLRWRPTPKLLLAPTAERVDVRLPAGDVTVNLWRGRAEVALTADWAVMAMAQYDSMSGTVGYNGRLRWLPHAGRSLELVVRREETHHDSGGALRAVRQRGGQALHRFLTPDS